MPAALAKRKFTVNVAGLRTDVDEHVLPPNAGVLELENCVFDVTGAVNKRRGFSALSSSIAPSGTIPNVWQLTTHKGSLLALSKVGSQPLFKWSPALSAWSAVSAANAPTRGPITVSRFPFFGSTSFAQIPDMASSGNYFALGFQPTNFSRESIIDGQTGKELYTASAAGPRQRVIALNGAFVFIWAAGSGSGHIFFDKWTVSTLATVGAPTQTDVIAGAIGTDPAFDAVATGADTIVVAYQHGDGTLHGIQYTVSTGVAGAPFQFKDAAAANIAASQCLGWAVQNVATFPVLLIADGTTGVKGHIYGSGVTANATVSTVIDAAATASVRNVTGWTTGATDYNVLYEVTGASSWLTLTKAGTKVGGVVATGVFQRSVGLRSRPWKGPDAQVYAVFEYDSTTQPSYFMIPLPTDPVGNPYTAPVARIATWNGNGQTEKSSCLASLLTYGSGGIVPLITKTRLETSTGQVYFDTSVSIYTIGQNDIIGRPVEAAGKTWTPGAVLHGFDGSRYVEAAWHIYPEGLSVSYSNVGGGGLVAGQTYSWIAVYRWLDAQGRIARSVPSTPIQGTVTAGNNSATVVVPTNRLNSIHDTQIPQVELYRLPSGGVTYFKTASGINGFSVDTVSIVDSQSDAALAGGELLYTTGGVLPSQPAPALFAVEQFDQRLVGIDAEDRSLIRMTSQFVDRIAPAWNENLTIRLNTRWGDATGLAVMDDKLLIFFRNAIYYIAGVGPDVSGNGSYNAPALIATGTGCAETQCQSIIYTGTGVMFLSDVGFQNIDRGLNVTDIGTGVQRYTDAGITVVGAIQVSPDSQIRFFTAEGTTLIWDYLHQAWSVSTAQPSTTAVMWGQTPVCALAATVYAEDGSFMERGARYEQKITFPWLVLAGLRGYQRLWRVQPVGLTSDQSGASLNVVFTFGYNFGDGGSHDQTITTIPGEIWEWEARPMRQLEESVRLGLRGVASGDSDRGFTLVGVTLLYGVKPGLYPIDKAKRAV